MAALAQLSVAQASSPPIHVVLAGDSTVTDDAGWGRGFAGSFRETLVVTNLAKHCRSSKIFGDEGFWRQVLAAKPD